MDLKTALNSDLSTVLLPFHMLTSSSSSTASGTAAVQSVSAAASHASSGSAQLTVKRQRSETANGNISIIAAVLPLVGQYLELTELLSGQRVSRLFRTAFNSQLAWVGSD